MKKLMIALAAAATTMFSFGAGTAEGENRDELVNDFGGWTGTSFEALTEDSVNVGDIVGKDDTGNQDGENKFWYSAAPGTDELGAITNEVAGAGVSRPDAFSTQGNTKSLQIDTTSPLFRTALPNSSGVQPVDIGDGIYLDTLVKFTAAEDAFADDLTGGDKIAIEYVEHEAEEGDVGYTNFVVRAGLIGAELGQTNYFAAVPANFNKDEWHRLTVRTIANVGDGNVGFVIYLDGDVDKTLEYPTTVDAGFGTLNATAAKFYNSEKHALFPSAVDAEDVGGSTISSVAFSGNGFIDDVSFAAEAPNFIKAGEAVPVAITLGTGVTGVTVTVGENAYNPVDATATPLVFNLPAGTTTFVLGVDADIDNGYTTTGITASNDVSYVGSTITITGGSPALTVVGKRDNVYYMDGENKVGFATLSAAFATAPAGTTLKLGFDYVVADNEGVPEAAPVFEITNDFVLDLNGKTLNGGGSDYYFLFSVAQDVTLTVIDSVDGDTGSIVYTGSYGMFGGEGEIYIGSTTMTDYGPVFEGLVKGEEGWVSLVYRGKFSYADNTKDDQFVATVALDSDIQHVGDYWVVTSQGGSEPVEVSFSVEAADANSSVVIKTNDVVVAYADLPETLTEGQSYEVTYTADEGYHFVTEQGNQTSIVVSGTVAKADITITAPTAVQDILGTYTVTVTPAANATYAAAYKSDDSAITPENDVLTVTVGQTIVITATPAANYEYAETPTGWSAGQAGEITIEVSEAGTIAIPAPTEKSSYPTYIPATDADAKAKYDTWADTYGADTGSAYEDAFLLNIAPDAADQTLEPASITISGSTVTITANQFLNKVNGKVYIKTAGTLAGLETASWGEATLNASGAVEMTSNGTAAFFKIKVDF